VSEIWNVVLKPVAISEVLQYSTIELELSCWNPLTPVFEGFRVGFLGVGTVTIEQLAWSFVLMAAVLSAGTMLFTRVERTFMDTV